MKKIITLCLLTTLIILTTACSTNTSATTGIEMASQSTTIIDTTDQVQEVLVSSLEPITVVYDPEDIEPN